MLKWRLANTLKNLYDVPKTRYNLLFLYFFLFYFVYASAFSFTFYVRIISGRGHDTRWTVYIFHFWHLVFHFFNFFLWFAFTLDSNEKAKVFFFVLFWCVHFLWPVVLRGYWKWREPEANGQQVEKLRAQIQWTWRECVCVARKGEKRGKEVKWKKICCNDGENEMMLLLITWILNITC